ncbi:hypothetical protein FB645_003335 [Coemansia sp. IMI 203386]|nr:hypothetical protein FB645_003335 [Coemansia sp. IMI 203386]
MVAVAYAGLCLGVDEQTTSNVSGNVGFDYTGTGTCPAPDRCYIDAVRPSCKQGEPCLKMLRRVVACAWQCKDQNLPKGCRQRCKPCKQVRCPRICECEIECSAFESCSVAQPSDEYTRLV